MSRSLLITLTFLLFISIVNGDDADEDTSLVKILQKEDALEGLSKPNQEHVQQIENNINGGGFVGDEAPVSFQKNQPSDVLSSENQSYLQPKQLEDDNAQKREGERFEETVGNPNPRPEFFVTKNMFDLNQVESKMEMEEGDAGKDISNEGNGWQLKPTADSEKNDTVPSNLHNKNQINPSNVQNGNKEIQSNVQDEHKDLTYADDPLKIRKIIVEDKQNSEMSDVKNNTDTSLQNEENNVNQFSSSEAHNMLDYHHNLDSKNPDEVSFTEEERLSKRLKFLKEKLKEKHRLSHMKSNKDPPPLLNFASQHASNNQVQPKYVMRLMDSPLNNTAKTSTMFHRPEMAFKNLTSVLKKPPMLLRKELFAFSYDPTSPFGPQSWQTLNPDWTCKGRKQSPINIDNRYIMDNQIVKNVLLKIDPVNSPITGVIKNNGHSPTLTLSNDISIKLFGGTLTNDYFLKQMHFHFGCDSTLGSEHHIDGIIYPLELHLVFWDNSTFVSFPDAAKADRGIAVLAVLYQLETLSMIDSKNTPMSQITQVLHHIEEEGDEITLTEEFNFRLEKLIPNVMGIDQVDRFYTYEGSLSTPGCYESVTWVVLATHPPVIESQLDIFRKLKSTKLTSGDKMCNNTRPLQKKNGRRIYSNII